MKFNELTAEQLMASMALIGEAAEHIMQGGIGEDLVKEVAAYRGKANGDAAKATEWAAGIIGKYLPRVMKENVEDLYKILAAVDGQSLEEYEACSDARKIVKDVAELKKAMGKDGELRELVAGFFN